MVISKGFFVTETKKIKNDDIIIDKDNENFKNKVVCSNLELINLTHYVHDLLYYDSEFKTDIEEAARKQFGGLKYNSKYINENINAKLSETTSCCGGSKKKNHKVNEITQKLKNSKIQQTNIGNGGTFQISDNTEIDKLYDVSGGLLMT